MPVQCKLNGSVRISVKLSAWARIRWLACELLAAHARALCQNLDSIHYVKDIQ